MRDDYGHPQRSVSVAPSSRSEEESEDFHKAIMRGGLYILILFSATALIIHIVTQLSPPPPAPRDPLDPIERERVRKQWQLEMEKHREELHNLVTKRDQERRYYEEEHQRYIKQKQQWEVDRRQHDAEQRRWAEERARELGQLWDEPRMDRRCAGYNRREYTATLDPYAACRHAPLMIHGKPLAPTYCESASPYSSHGDIVGHWTVEFDEPGCRPH